MSKRILSSFDIVGRHHDDVDGYDLSSLALGQLVMKNIMDNLPTVTARVMLALTCRRALAALVQAARQKEWPLAKIKRGVEIVERLDISGLEHVAGYAGSRVECRDTFRWAEQLVDDGFFLRQALFRGVVEWSLNSYMQSSINCAHAQELLYRCRCWCPAGVFPAFGGLGGLAAAYKNMYFVLISTPVDRKRAVRVVRLAAKMTVYATEVLGEKARVSVAFMLRQLAQQWRPCNMSPQMQAVFSSAVMAGIAQTPEQRYNLLDVLAVLL